MYDITLVGFIGSTDDTFFSTEPGVEDGSQVFGGVGSV